MTTPKPPPRTWQPAEERQIQLFLERAAPIVLADPRLTAERWRELARLAAELELTADQFHQTIDDLLHRGVMRRTEELPAKPPPLPGRTPDEVPPSLVDRRPAEDFALSPPPVSRPAVAEQVPGKGREAGAGSGPGNRLPVPSRDPTVSAEVEPPPLAGAKSAERAEKGVERTAGPRWRQEGAPAPLPPPAPKAPAETFRDFARASLAAVRSELIPEAAEQRILLHGTRVLGLSAVFARQLLAELVEQMHLRLASAATAAANVPEPVPDNPRLSEFLRAAGPVLAQHRGVTAQSRVLLLALARERGLSDGETEQALAQLAGRDRLDPSEVARQERLPPYRSYVETQLRKSARGVLIPTLADKLILAGQQLFGVEMATAGAIMRDCAAALQLAVVTPEQAERHLVELLADLLPTNTYARREERERLEIEGAQWGLAVGRVHELLDSHCRENARRRHAEQRFTRLALAAAASFIIALLSFFVWQSPAFRSSPSAAKSAAPVGTSSARSDSGVKREKSWMDIDTELAIAVIQVRTGLPGLREPLKQLAANEPLRRDQAYTQLLATYLDESLDEPPRRELGELLARALALDPAEPTVTRTLDNLLQGIPAEAAERGLDVATVTRCFRSVWVAAHCLFYSRDREPRSALVVAALQKVLGVAPDPQLPLAAAERVCLATLSERLFRTLTTLAASPFPGAVELHAAITRQSLEWVEANRIERFHGDFLAAYLGSDPRRWEDVAELARQVAQGTEPLAVLRLVELIESTSDVPLRSALSQLLRGRLPDAPADLTDDQLAMQIRQSLGITAASDPEGAWRRLSRDAGSVLEQSPASAEPIEPILDQTLRLAHFATLACALAQNESANAAVLEWRKAGPRTTASAARGESAGESASPTAAVAPGDRVALTSAFRRWQSARSPTDQLEALRSLAVLGAQLDELRSEDLTRLGNYLLAQKSQAENERIAELARDLGKSNRLTLVIADRLEESRLDAAALRVLLQSWLGAAVAHDSARAGFANLRQELLQLVEGRLQQTAGAAAGGSQAGLNAARGLSAAYLLQAKLLGITLPADRTADSTPAELLLALITGLRERLTDAKLPAPDQATLQLLIHETAARRASAASDVQEIVGLERVWLQLLALEVSRRVPPQAVAARELLSRLDEQDVGATHVLSQLRDGQAAILRMWMLLGKRS